MGAAFGRSVLEVRRADRPHSRVRRSVRRWVDLSSDVAIITGWGTLAPPIATVGALLPALPESATTLVLTWHEADRTRCLQVPLELQLGSPPSRRFTYPREPQIDDQSPFSLRACSAMNCVIRLVTAGRGRTKMHGVAWTSKAADVRRSDVRTFRKRNGPAQAVRASCAAGAGDRDRPIYGTLHGLPSRRPRRRCAYGTA